MEITTSLQARNEPSPQPMHFNNVKIERRRGKTTSTRARSGFGGIATVRHESSTFSKFIGNRRHSDEHADELEDGLEDGFDEFEDDLILEEPKPRRVKLSATERIEREGGSSLPFDKKRAGSVFEYGYPMLTNHRISQQISPEEQLQILENEVEDLEFVRSLRRISLDDGPPPPSPEYPHSSTPPPSTSHFASSNSHQGSRGSNFTGEEIKSQAASYLSQARWKVIQDNRYNGKFRVKMYKAWLAKSGQVI